MASNTAGPESLVDYFQKGALLGQKVTSLLRRYQAFVKTVPEHLKVCHIWLIKFKKKIMCSYIFFSHIIKLSLFSNEYFFIACK